MITAIGGILLPLSLILANRPWRLLALVFFYSVFAAAAIVTVGGAGITPALVPASLFALSFLVSVFSGVRYPGERRALVLLTPFILVVTGALASSVIMPRLFLGEVLVWPQKVSLFFVRSPLAPNAGNYTQDMYLLSNALLTTTAAIYLTRPGAKLGKLFDCYLSASFLADAIAFWQFAGNTFHVWYPTAFFLSNPGWAQLSDESVGSLIRLNGTFSEPSSLSAYLSAVVCASAWLILNGDKRRMPRFAFGFGLVVVLVSTATTGYTTLGAMICLLVLRSVASGSAKFKQRAAAGLFAGLMVITTVVVVTPMIAPKVASEAAMVVTSTLNKGQTSSYRARTAVDHDSFGEMVATSGLGVGWGSNRSSSLLPGLCAAIGIWGIGGLIWFGISLYLGLRKIPRYTRNSELRLVVNGASAAVLSTLVSGVISEPTISSPDFYLLLAILVAAAARVPQRSAAMMSQDIKSAKPVHSNL